MITGKWGGGDFNIGLNRLKNNWPEKLYNNVKACVVYSRHWVRCGHNWFEYSHRK